MRLLTEAKLTPGMKALVRMDLDVPDNDYFRLESGLPTLNYLIENKVIPVIAGHIGRPGGSEDSNLSTQKLKPYFDTYLGINQYELLENLRFNPGEESNDNEFSKELASKADIYINESFATSHRKHASIVGVAGLLPSYAGLNLQKEVEVLSNVIKSPNKPLTVLVGGAKLESKKPVVSKFIKIANNVLLGGLIGLNWDEQIPQNLHIPTDYIYDEQNNPRDIGAETTAQYIEIITNSNTIVWAGPLGQFEVPEFATSTNKIASLIPNSNSYWVVGGGDTISALKSTNTLNYINWVSTGGSAMLEFIVNETLPGIEALGYKKEANG